MMRRFASVGTKRKRKNWKTQVWMCDLSFLVSWQHGSKKEAVGASQASASLYIARQTCASSWSDSFWCNALIFIFCHRDSSFDLYCSQVPRYSENLTTCTVIPAMVQRLHFSINVQHLSHRFALTEGQRWQRLKHRWERVPKTHKIGFTGEVLHIYGRVT